jgi:hypothetical protein
MLIENIVERGRKKVFRNYLGEYTHMYTDLDS